MAKVNAVQVVELMRDLGPSATNLQIAEFVATAYAENYGTRTEHDLRDDLSNDKGNDPAGSIDRGMWMLNSHWWAEVSDECAFDWKCATAAVAKRTKGFTSGITQWVAYTNGNYKVHLPIAWMTIRLADSRAREAALRRDILLIDSKLASCQAERQRVIDELIAAQSRIAAARAAAADSLEAAGVVVDTLA